MCIFVKVSDSVEGPLDYYVASKWISPKGKERSDFINTMDIKNMVYNIY